MASSTERSSSGKIKELIKEIVKHIFTCNNIYYRQTVLSLN